MKIILQSKTWKNFKRLLVKGLIFNNKPKIREILLGFCQGTQGDANFWVGLKKIHHHYNTIAVDILKYLMEMNWTYKHKDMSTLRRCQSSRPNKLF